MIQLLSLPLGYIMYACYSFCQNYALAIILFTLLTKIILLPISIWVHRNGIKMVSMMPELNRVKSRFFGDGDRIADETQALYKRAKYNPFAGLIPLFIQIFLLIGLIQVIYNPLTHLLHMDAAVSKPITELVCELIGANPESGSLQLQAVQVIQTGMYDSEILSIPGMDASVLEQIRGLDLKFAGISLGGVPMTEGGILFLVPLLAGFASWLLCVCQDRMNPLQAEQSKTEQRGTMAFSVGISLFLGFLVPAGVGFYWIWSNLFTIVQQLFLNQVISPKKYIDYAALEESKKELAALENLGVKKKWYEHDPNAKREKADYKRFFSIVNKHVVFYSEGSGFYKYFQNVMDYLLAHSNLTLHYITSDPDDQIFGIAKKKPRIQPYYIGEKRLITLMMKMDADMVIMPMPDINNFHIKRSYVRPDIEYIYMFHWPTSTIMTIREHALDHYDTIFCPGPHQMEEIRYSEKMHGLPEKTLINASYGVMENLADAVAKMELKENKVPQILIAPSHQPDNLMDSCIDELLSQILGCGYRVIVRPHPQYIRRVPQKIEAFRAKYQREIGDGTLEFETDFSSNETVYQSDLVITDWSNIAVEFSLTTMKPSLFINTPMKVINPHYTDYPMKPLEIMIRDQIGHSLEPAELSQAGRMIREMLTSKEQYNAQIMQVRSDIMPEFGRSGEIGGQYIISQLIKNKRKKENQNEN